MTCLRPSDPTPRAARPAALRLAGPLVAAALLGACGHARVHYQDADGGVLTLHDDEERALADARERMAAHCGARGHQIVRRETVAIGEESYTKVDHAARAESKAEGERQASLTPASAPEAPPVTVAAQRREQTTRDDAARTTTVSGVRVLTEHRVTYVCR